ncbi:MAG: hypothetical protein QOK11_1037 [Pseudonocardiales bacterium]|nr:hypothetical protein [Pseudonocardiales bacterium]
MSLIWRGVSAGMAACLLAACSAHASPSPSPRTTRNQDIAAVLRAGAGTTAVTPTLPVPALPVLRGDRLAAPFSMEDGMFRLIPISDGYEPAISAKAAETILHRYPGPLDPSPLRQPLIFLATMTAYESAVINDPKTGAPRQVPNKAPVHAWVSVKYVQQVSYGLAPAPIGLSDELITIDADTGQLLSGINVGGQDAPARTSA